MSLFLDDGDVRLYHGDALTVLQTLEAGSVHMCVTSPPFYGLRDYGTGRWEGGTATDCPDCTTREEQLRCKTCLGTGEIDCDHTTIPARSGRGGSGSPGKNTEGAFPSEYPAPECGKCGARRVDQQIGLEATPEQWVENLVNVFREVRRVLRDDGTLWLEIGDSYCASQGGRQSSVGELPNRPLPQAAGLGTGDAGSWQSGATTKLLPQRGATDLKPKDLVGAPWMLAFALRADGWYLRSDIVWARPNPMPESVTDRPTKSHSYIFLLSKQPRYFFDQEAVREDGPTYTRKAGGYNGREAPGGRFGKASRFSGSGGFGDSDVTTVGRNVRSVWTIPGGDIVVSGGALPAPPPDGASSGGAVPSVWNIATQPYPEAHFATFPEELARRCILAGTSERGCCPECGAPWIREVLATGADNHRVREDVGDWIKHKGGNADGKRSLSGSTYKRQREAGDWRPSCGCNLEEEGAGRAANHGRSTSRARGGWRRPPLRFTSCVVLDPFVGSGTVPYVARKHGRHAIGIDLSQAYLELAARRLQQLSLFA